MENILLIIVVALVVSIPWATSMKIAVRSEERSMKSVCDFVEKSITKEPTND